MSEIVLTEEQAKVVTRARNPVRVRDDKGNIVGTINPVWSEADIEEAKRILATSKTWHTTGQIDARLSSLEKP